MEQRTPSQTCPVLEPFLGRLGRRIALLLALGLRSLLAQSFRRRRSAVGDDGCLASFAEVCEGARSVVDKRELAGAGLGRVLDVEGDEQKQAGLVVSRGDTLDAVQKERRNRTGGCRRRGYTKSASDRERNESRGGAGGAPESTTGQRRTTPRSVRPSESSA